MYDKLCVLDNNCSIHSYLENVISSFQKLYSKKAFIHHFKDIIDDAQFQQVNENITEVAQTYRELERNVFTSTKHLDQKILRNLGNTISATDAPNRSITTEKSCGMPLKMQAKSSKGLKVWCIKPNHLDSVVSCKSGKHWWDLCASPIV